MTDPPERVRASRFILQEGLRIAATGHLAAGPAEFWVRPSWGEPIRRLKGANVPLAGTGVSGLPRGRLLHITGHWAGGRVVVERTKTVEPSLPHPEISADHDAAEAVAQLSEDAYADVAAEATAQAQGLVIASGGGRGLPLHLQVLHVVPVLAAWHENRGRQFVTLLPSITPIFETDDLA